MRLSNRTIATALNELGYDGEYKSFYMPDGTLEDIEYKVLTGQPIYGGENHIPCPRLDDAAYWLRDKHGILITPEYCWNSKWGVSIYFNFRERNRGLFTSEGHDSCEDALETAIMIAIEFINNPQIP